MQAESITNIDYPLNWFVQIDRPKIQETNILYACGRIVIYRYYYYYYSCCWTAATAAADTSLPIQMKLIVIVGVVAVIRRQ